MTKSEFIKIYILPYIVKTDKAFNRMLWNEQINFCIASGTLKESAGNWSKEPKKYFGEVIK